MTLPPPILSLLRDPNAAPFAPSSAAHAAALLRAHVLRRISNALSTKAQRAMLVKGAALALTVYPSPASRLMSDIDLLVERERERDVIDALECEGCAVHLVHDRPLTRHLLGETLLSMPAGAILTAIEVHTTLDKLVPRPIDERDLFARALPAPDLPALLIPAPEDHALLVALHAATHELRHPIAILDLELLLRRGLDIAILAERARAYRLETAIYTLLLLMRDHGAASVDHALLATFDPGPIRRAIARRFCERARAAHEAAPLGLPWVLGQTLLRDDLGAWTLGLARFTALRGLERALAPLTTTFDPRCSP